jgi:hypothetical protein
MATDKLFSVVGVSCLNGEYKVRFANDTARVKVLGKHGHTDVVMIELDEAVSKVEAATFIQSLDEFQHPLVQAAISEFLDKANGGKKRATKRKEPDTASEAADAADDTAEAEAADVSEDAELEAAREMVADLDMEPF